MSSDSTLADDERVYDESVPVATAPGFAETPAKRRRGELLGRYVLLDPIGRGGMGAVYSAYDPELDRRIALKLLHAEGSERAGLRLLREAQAMAKLVHPNVIAVHDVGSFEGGVFVAMELVEGSDLRTWLDGPSRSPSEILEVFTAAGRGLHAAHRAGIVHRDFKPANVLVSRDGEVKVVDFGIARRVEDGSDGSELRELSSELDIISSSGGYDHELTRTGAALGTPAYMSPEQHTRQPVDARTDQFSFCVALYEALFGQRPFEGGSRVMLAMAATRGEVQPPPKGHAVPGRVVRAVLRGLSAAPGERFESMAELLAELGHDPTRRRNRVLIGTAVAGLLAIGIYGYAREDSPEAPVCPDPRPVLDGTWDGEQREGLRGALAEGERPHAADDARFVTERLDAWADAWVDARHDACTRTRVHAEDGEPVLELRIACLERQRKDLGAVVRLLREADPEITERADRMVASLPSPRACEDGAALGRVAPPADERMRAEVDAIRDELSEVRALRAAGRYGEGTRRATDLRARAEATGYQPVIADLLLTLGNLYNHGGNQAQGEQVLHAAAQAAAEARYDEVLADAWLELAWNLGMGQNRPEDGLRWAGYAEAVINRMGRPDWLRNDLLCTQGNLAWVARDTETAIERYGACLQLRESIDPDDPDVANTLSYLGNAQIDLGRFEDAQASFERALAIATAARGPEHPQVAAMHNGLGVALYYRHRLEDAEKSYRRAYEINRAILGPDHADLLYPLGNIANIRREKGEIEPALEAMLDVEALVAKAFPAVHREVGTTQHNIAELLALKGDLEEALRRYDHALRVREEVHGADAPQVANTLTGKGEVLLALSRLDEARVVLERALEIREREEHPKEHERGRTRFALARVLDRLGVEAARARRLVEAARRDYEMADSALQRTRRDEMDAWLAEHGGP